MKKISLKNITEGLKRDEMRMIQGGSGCGAGVGSYCTVGHNIFNCAPNLICVRDLRFGWNAGICGVV
jgi:hypothetical protein